MIRLRFHKTVTAPVLLSACSGSGPSRLQAKTLTNPVQPTPQSLESGKVLYQQNCANCHGATGNGVNEQASTPANDSEIKPADLTDDKWEHGSTDGEIFMNIRDGIGPKSLSAGVLRKGPMRGLNGKPGITEQDIWHVVNYVRTLCP